jgi:hypothetical protein
MGWRVLRAAAVLVIEEVMAGSHPWLGGG